MIEFDKDLNVILIEEKTKIGNKVIIGAGSIVTKDIPDNSVYAGNTARYICSYDEYMDKNKKMIEDSPNFQSPFWIWPDKDKSEWEDMKEKLSSSIGYL